MRAPYHGYNADAEADEGDAGWVVLRAATHTARKPHGCDCCDGRIEPGERYRLTVALEYGRHFVITRAHVRACWQDRERNEAARDAENRRAYDEAMAE